MSEVELLTPEPIGLGTKFRARMANAGMDMLIELTEFDRPRRLGSRTTSSMMETTGTLTCTSEAARPCCHGTGKCTPKAGTAP
jgi:hypothetical protein